MPAILSQVGGGVMGDNDNVTHPATREGRAIVLRFHPMDGWQCWRHWDDGFGAGFWSTTGFRPDGDVPVVEWEDTWCEPEADD